MVPIVPDTLFPNNAISDCESPLFPICTAYPAVNPLGFFQGIALVPAVVFWAT